MIAEADTALTAAMTAMSPNMNLLASTFAKFPNDSSEELVKEILDATIFVVAAGSGYFWNVFAKDAQWFTSGLLKTKFGLNDDWRGALKDVSNAGIAWAFNANKDGLGNPKIIGDEAQDLGGVLSAFYQAMTYTQNSFLESTLSANTTDSQTTLTNLISGRMMCEYQQLSNASRFDDLTAAAQQLLYGRMIPAAWSISQNHQRPFIL